MDSPGGGFRSWLSSRSPRLLRKRPGHLGLDELFYLFQCESCGLFRGSAGAISFFRDRDDLFTDFDDRAPAGILHRDFFVLPTMYEAICFFTELCVDQLVHLGL